MVDENGYQYYDIINELKVVDKDKKVCTTIKLSLNRDAVVLSSESDNAQDAKNMILTFEKMVNELK